MKRPVVVSSSAVFNFYSICIRHSCVYSKYSGYSFNSGSYKTNHQQLKFNNAHLHITPVLKYLYILVCSGISHAIQYFINSTINTSLWLQQRRSRMLI